MNDKDIKALFEASGNALSDDAAFLRCMERNLDCVQLAKERNDRLAATARKKVLWIAVSGICAAAVIVLLVVFGKDFGTSDLAARDVYTILYAVVAAALCSTAILTYGLLFTAKAQRSL